ncbi:peroxiredoxin family protein [Lutibacter flavus]|uniref:peroxiredoxin family protein n=1 Tax=Lutibacter flavus TaxID=691689 RepID=UPI000B7767FB|nr:TlpA disulfide reductase family protein [Lutibacter flavus]
MKRKLLLFFVLIIGVLFIGNAQIVQKGAKAPDFRLYALDGTINSLDTYKNKVVVIKMWFTTCAPCLHEIPKVNKLLEKYKNRNDIVFIAPAPNSKKTLKKFKR